MNLRRKMILFVLHLALLTSASADASTEPDPEESPYSPASPLHEVLEDRSSSNPFPRFLNLDSLQDIQLLIVRPQTPIVLSEADVRPAEARQAKSISLDRLRSMLGLPIQQGQGFPHQPSYGWPQRIRNSLSSMNPFARPSYMQQSGSHHHPTYFMPHHGMMPMMMRPQHPLHIGEFATASSMGAPSRLPSPFALNPANQHYFGPDLATSGSAAFAHYAAAMPKHRPLFEQGGIKGAGLDISNAFADFASSHEHGPDVTQKFGSVGHAMSTFLGMMGLVGPQNALTPEDVGGFGGGGSWASMDPSPIARSSDFYPGYGNMAHLENMDDFPIFQEDVTEAFMKKMNLTEFFKNATKEPTQEVMEKPVEKQEKPVEKQEKPVEKQAKPGKESTTEMPQPVYVPAHPLGAMKTPKEKDEASTTGPEKTTTESPTTQQPPVVNYKVPLKLPTVPPESRKPPVAIYQNFPLPSKEDSKQETPTTQPSWLKDESDPKSLINDVVLRQWVPVSYGLNYVEKQPKPIVDAIRSPETPRGLKILEQVLSHKPKPAQVQA